MTGIPPLLPDVLSIVALVALTVAALALVLAAGAWRRNGRLQRELADLREHYQLVMKGAEGADLAAALAASARRLATAEARVTALEGRSTDLDGRLRRAVTTVRMLRYRAFEDAGGDQSFALALLDEAADGAVVSGIHGRGGMRVYAKPVAAGVSSYNLTAEERAVIGGENG